VIFGGEHADVPINQSSGAAIAELVATGNRPCIIDLGGWMVGARTRFFIDFASHLFKLTRGARYLVIDEVHNFAPKMKVYDPDAGKMLHWANRIASEGAGKGLLLFGASQRPQKVHNDLLDSCETLIACKVIHKAGRDAIKDWIDGCADPVKGKEVMAGLAQMKRPEAWVWSPEAEFGPERVTFPLFSTYDSFKPQAADHAKLKGWASVDLEEVKTKLAAAVKEAEANDPELLKRQVAALRAQLAAADKAKPGKTATDIKLSQRELEVAERRGHDRALAAADEQIAAMVKDLRGAANAALATASATVLHQVFDHVKRPKPPKFQRAENYAKPIQAAPSARLAKHPTPQRGGNGEDTGLTGPEQRIVDAIAWLAATNGREEQPSTAVAFLAGYTYGGGGFNNPRSSLRTKGHVEYAGNNLRLTDSGNDLARVPRAALTAAEMHQRVLGVLGGPEQRLLKPILEAYPDAIDGEEVARAANYAYGTGGFNNPRSRLRTLGLIEYIGKGLRASDALFPGG
jgi:hypothetical protein